MHPRKKLIKLLRINLKPSIFIFFVSLLKVRGTNQFYFFLFCQIKRKNEWKKRKGKKRKRNCSPNNGGRPFVFKVLLSRGTDRRTWTAGLQAGGKAPAHQLSLCPVPIALHATFATSFNASSVIFPPVWSTGERGMRGQGSAVSWDAVFWSFLEHHTAL
jgi:hypothetical protein